MGEKMMNQLRILAFSLLIFYAGLLAQIQPANPAKVGLGLNLGVQKPFCDVVHTGAGLAGEVMLRYLISPRINLSISGGYGFLNDGFVTKTFETNIIAADLKINLNLMKPGRINPYILLGVGITNYEYDKLEPYAIGADANVGERFSDGSFIYGGGFEFLVNPKLAINTFADYRFSTGDALDGAESGDYKDGYVNIRLGFTRYLGNGYPIGPADDDLLALEQLDLNQLEDDDYGTQKPSNLQQLESEIDNLEREETDYSMERYVRLKSRVDELNRQVDEKNNELMELQSSLLLKNNRIAELETTTPTTTSNLSSDAISGKFSVDYEQALRLFYARDYSNAIQVWDILHTQYPNYKLTSNCQYWIGEAYFGLGQYENAVKAFQNVFNYDFSYKKDDATLMLGRSYLKLGDVARARSYFQGVIDDYPQSEYVEKAREWLRRIG